MSAAAAAAAAANETDLESFIVADEDFSRRKVCFLGRLCCCYFSPAKSASHYRGQLAFSQRISITKRSYQSTLLPATTIQLPLVGCNIFRRQFSVNLRPAAAAAVGVC